MCLGLEQWTLIVQIIVAVILAITVIFAFRSAKASQKMVYSQTIWQILDAYSSSDMSKAMRVLENWKIQYKDRHGEKFLELKEKSDKRANEPNEARRLYAHHFHKIKRLLDAKVLDKSHVKLVTTLGQVKFLIDYVEPLEDKSKPDWDDSTYRFFEELWNIGNKEVNKGQTPET